MKLECNSHTILKDIKSNQHDGLHLIVLCTCLVDEQVQGLIEREKTSQKELKKNSNSRKKDDDYTVSN